MLAPNVDDVDGLATSVLLTEALREALRDALPLREAIVLADIETETDGVAALAWLTDALAVAPALLEEWLGERVTDDTAVPVTERVTVRETDVDALTVFDADRVTLTVAVAN